MPTHAVQPTKGPWRPSVPRQRRADEDVKEPRYQCASHGEDQDGIKGSLKPLDDGPGAKEQKNNRRLDER